MYGAVLAVMILAQRADGAAHKANPPAQETVSYSRIELLRAQGLSLPGQTNGGTEYVAIEKEHCFLRVAPHGKIRDDSSCFAEKLPSLDFVFHDQRYVLTPEAVIDLGAAKPGVDRDGSVTLPERVGGEAAILLHPRVGNSVWVPALADGDKIRQSPALKGGGLSGTEIEILARREAGGALLHWTMQVPAPPPPPAQVEDKTATDLVKILTTKSCTVDPKKGDVRLIIDATGASSVRSHIGAGAGALLDDGKDELLPNTEFVVAVIARRDVAVHVATKGKAGDYIPVVMNAPGGTTNAKPSEVLTGQTPNPFELACFRFAPRLPGDATITVKTGTVGDNGKETQSEGVDFDLLVRNAYAGALRVGLGSVWGAKEGLYSTRGFSGGASTSIVENPSSVASSELVVGYAPFIGDYWFSTAGGRTYGRDGTPLWARFAPYLGFGVLSAGSTGVDWFRSIHLGVEWEAAPNFSIAATFVLHRTSTLAPGLTVGGPAPDSGSLTATVYRPAFGIVLNVTPDLFRFGSTLFGK